MAAMQPGRIPLYLLHGNVLRAPHPGQKFVEEDEDMADVGLEFLQGDTAMAAMAVAKRKSGSDGCHPTAPEGLVVQCSSEAVGEAGSVPEQITPPSCTPWDYHNVYRCATPLLPPRVTRRSGEPQFDAPHTGAASVLWLCWASWCEEWRSSAVDVMSGGTGGCEEAAAVDVSDGMFQTGSAVAMADVRRG